jgi:hypothetical protein
MAPRGSVLPRAPVVCVYCLDERGRGFQLELFEDFENFEPLNNRCRLECH